MNYFISNFKTQTLKSILITIFITSLAVYIYWSIQPLIGIFSYNLFFPSISFFTPFFIEVIVYTLGIACITARKGWIYGLVLGLILSGLFVVPEFIRSAFQNDGFLTLHLAILVIIDNLIQLAIPATLLAHFRNS
jgi:hypothetical protein